MTELLQIASSPWWIVLTFIGIAATVYDWRIERVWAPWLKNLTVGLVLASVMGTVLYAAEVPNQNWCVLWNLQPSDPMYWILSCWAL